MRSQTIDCVVCGQNQPYSNTQMMPRGYVCNPCVQRILQTPGADLDLTFSEAEQEAQWRKHRRWFVSSAVTVVVVVLLLLAHPHQLDLVDPRFVLFVLFGAIIETITEPFRLRGFKQRARLRERYKRGEIPALTTPVLSEDAAVEQMRAHRRAANRKRLLFVLGFVVVGSLIVWTIVSHQW